MSRSPSSPTTGSAGTEDVLASAQPRPTNHDSGKKLEEARFMRKQLSDTFSALDQITSPGHDPSPSLGAVLLRGDSRSRISVESMLSRLATATSSIATAAPSPTTSQPSPSSVPPPFISEGELIAQQAHPQPSSPQYQPYPHAAMNSAWLWRSGRGEGSLHYPYRPYAPADLAPHPAYLSSSPATSPSQGAIPTDAFYCMAAYPAPPRIVLSRRSIDGSDMVPILREPPTVRRFGSGQAPWSHGQHAFTTDPSYAPQQCSPFVGDATPNLSTFAPHTMISSVPSPAFSSAFSPGLSSTASLESLGSDSSSVFEFFGDLPELAPEAQHPDSTPPREKKRRKQESASASVTGQRANDRAADWCGSTESPTSSFSRSMLALPQMWGADYLNSPLDPAYLASPPPTYDLSPTTATASRSVPSSDTNQTLPLADMSFAGDDSQGRLYSHLNPPDT